MSLINDALKRAQQNSAPKPPPAIPPLKLQAAPPVQRQPSAVRTGSPVTAWLLPAILIFLVIAAVFAVGWTAAHRSVTRVIPTPEPVAAALPAQAVQAPETAPVSVPDNSTPDPVADLKPSVVINPANAPKLQGIFYSPTKPSAILDGQTVRPGDSFQQFRVKEITQNTVTLTKADGSAIRLGIGR
jgi:anti-sigma factor RsiW